MRNSENKITDKQCDEFSVSEVAAKIKVMITITILAKTDIHPYCDFKKVENSFLKNLEFDFENCSKMVWSIKNPFFKLNSEVSNAGIRSSG